jgi:hypothetical protein
MWNSPTSKILTFEDKHPAKQLKSNMQFYILAVVLYRTNSQLLLKRLNQAPIWQRLQRLISDQVTLPRKQSQLQFKLRLQNPERPNYDCNWHRQINFGINATSHPPQRYCLSSPMRLVVSGAKSFEEGNDGTRFTTSVANNYRTRSVQTMHHQCNGQRQAQVILVTVM